MYDIKNILKGNIRLYCMIQKLDRSVFFRKAAKYERRYNSLLRSVSGIDPIADYKEYRKVLKPAVKTNTPWFTTLYGGESNHYGYYDELLNYSGRKQGIVPLMPAFEHGVRFGSPVRSYDQRNLCYTAQGRNRNCEIHNIDPWKMVFSVGPYIHYARDQYNKEQFYRLKKELGKVLLVFPSHTWEEDDILGSDKSLTRRIMKKYAAKYDTVMVCMYWYNVYDPVAESFEAEGAKMVSAGFRGDKNFIRRLKTIIRLADDVAVDDIGTNIGFCKYMNKRVFFEGGEKAAGNDAMFIENYRLFREAFTSNDGSFFKQQLSDQKALYEAFWGGTGEILSKTQAQKMFDALKEIYSLAAYHPGRLPAAERAFLLNCCDMEQREIIRRSLSTNLKI